MLTIDFDDNEKIRIMRTFGKSLRRINENGSCLTKEKY